VDAGWRWLLRTLTIDRLAEAAERSASSAATASTKAVARIGEGMVIGIAPSGSGREGTGQGAFDSRQLPSLLWQRQRDLSPMTKK
jgi:hypothetical protein